MPGGLNKQGVGSAFDKWPESVLQKDAEITIGQNHATGISRCFIDVQSCQLALQSGPQYYSARPTMPVCLCHAVDLALTSRALDPVKNIVSTQLNVFYCVCHLYRREMKLRDHSKMSLNHHF